MITKTTLGLMLALTMALAFEGQAKDANEAQKAVANSEAAEGVNSAELKILKKHYKWKKGEELPASYTLEELFKVMDDCAD